MSSYDVIVIGAGINSLAAAAMLKKAGKNVLVLEKRDSIGGAAATEELIKGFRFNTVADSVGYLPGEYNMQQGLRVELKPENAVSMLLPDGGAYTHWRDNRDANSWSQRERDAWQAFSELMHKSAGFLAALYEQPSPRPIDGGTGDLFAMAMLGRRARKLGRAHMIELLRIMPMSVAELVGDYLENETLKALVAGQGIAGMHQGPMSAGTTFTLLHHHIGQAPGAFRMVDRVRGGNGNLADAYARGLNVRTNAEVSEIVVERGRAVAVRVGNETLSAGRIVSGLDVKTTLIDLVDVAQLDPEFLHAVQHVRSRGVVARVHFALAELPRFNGVSDEAMRGVISIGPDVSYLERAYDDVKYNRLSARPFVEARIPSLDDSSLAPSGRHTMSVSLQYVPYDADSEAVADLAVKTLSEYAPNFATSIIDRRVFTPRDLEREYGLPQGNVEHAELALDQILFMRPVPECARHATPIENLFLCGAGTHPGRAIVGLSAKHATREILAR